MDIKIVGQEPQVETQEFEGPKGDTMVPNQRVFDGVAQLFDINPNESTKFESKLNTLIDYAKTQTDDHTPEGIKWALRMLQGKVGTPPLGQKWVDYLSRFAYLSLESNKLDKELTNFIKNGHNNRAV